MLFLGGGMAGMAAAKTRHDAGFTNFKVLEATSRVGGRMEETKVGNFSVELGAMYIYGMRSNPIYKLALESNLSFITNYTDEWTVRNDVGKDVTAAADEIYDKLKAKLELFDRKSKRSEKCGVPDFTVRAGLRNLNWRPRTSLDKTVEAYYIV